MAYEPGDLQYDINDKIAQHFPDWGMPSLLIVNPKIYEKLLELVKLEFGLEVEHISKYTTRGNLSLALFQSEKVEFVEVY